MLTKSHKHIPINGGTCSHISMHFNIENAYECEIKYLFYLYYILFRMQNSTFIKINLCATMEFDIKKKNQNPAPNRTGYRADCQRIKFVGL